MRRVVFDDELFASLGTRLPDSRTAGGVPSRSDSLAYEIPRLMDALAEDSLAATKTRRIDGLDPGVDPDSRLARNTVLWRQPVDHVIHAFDVDE